MHYQFLIEDRSSAALVEIIMRKVVGERQDVTYDCKFFKGIGGFTKKNTVKETKNGKLLNDLATYLRGFDKSLRHIPAAIFVVVDNDERDTAAFRSELNDVALQNGICVDYVFCVAVEEVEAWLLGDERAVVAAYPAAKTQIIDDYEQDSICGTWEVLANAVYPGGLTKFLKDCPSYTEKGAYKFEWAAKIGEFMDLANNKSPSFNNFMCEINRRLPT